MDDRDGPGALFCAPAAWLQEDRVLLPGVTMLAQLVVTVRRAAASGNPLYTNC